MDDQFDSMEKTYTGGERVAEIHQLPIPVTEALIRARFDHKKDDEGLPRFRFPDDTHNRAMVWSEWVPFMRDLLEEEECTITYYAIETRFDVAFPPDPGDSEDLPEVSPAEKKVI